MYRSIIDTLNVKRNLGWESSFTISHEMSEKIYVIPPDRTRYLSEIVEENKRYDKSVSEQSSIARKLYQLKGAIEVLAEQK